MSEYADALPLLNAALADLKKGQLVYDERYAMMDLMSAIEINDARTDTYLHAKGQQEKQQPPLPPFDPSQTLSAEDIVWVTDEILRLEATFLSGHPLSSTLWTCNYLRLSSLATLSGVNPSSTSPPPSALSRIVFRALLLGTLKCSEIVYEEMSKGQVYEHEDVHLTLSSLSFNSLMASCFPPLPPPEPAPISRLALPGQQGLDNPEQPPQERTVSVDDVLRALDEALRWLSAQREGEDGRDESVSMDEEVREALIARVTMRIDLVYVLALLTAPSYSSPAQIKHHLSRLSSYSALFPSASSPSSPSPAPSFTPSPSLLAIFSPSPSVPLLGTPQPPRPVTPLGLEEGYDLLLRETVRDLDRLMSLWEGWTTREEESEGWKEIREYCTAAGRRGGTPYVRSVEQSVIATPSHIFSTSPPPLLTLTFLSTLARLSPILLQRLSLIRSQHETSPAQPAHRVLAWAERTAALFLVPTTAGLSGQNRGRQRRIAVKSAGKFAGLVREAEGDIVPLLIGGGLAPSVGAEEDDLAAVRRIPAAIAAHALEVVLEGLMSGFEEDVGLLREEEEARMEGWWVGERVAVALERLWERLMSGGKGEGEGQEATKYLSEKKAEASAVKEMCRASWMSCALAPSSPPPKFSSPFLSDLAFPPALAARGRFNQRFDWLAKLSTPSTTALSGCENLASWEAYQADLAGMKKDEASALSQAKDTISRVIEHLDTLKAFSAVADRSQQQEWFAALRETATANFAGLGSFGGEEGGRATAPLSWRHSWFAQWT
ncbi:hypothetical protein JCM6882_005731 [Rhodosporidiobolus microsporus]